MSDISTKIAKLLRLSEDVSASEGEIASAVAKATELMQRHHLTRDDIDMKNVDDPTKNVVFDIHTVNTLSAKLYQWEVNLFHFITDFMGSVNYYVERGKFKASRGGIAVTDEKGNQKITRRAKFYGPDDDCESAARLYYELSEAIRAMAIVKYASWAKGDGAAYCQGFVRGLDDKLHDARIALEEGDSQTQALMVLSEDTQLALSDASKAWLTKTKGVKLVNGAASTGTRTGSSSAMRSGISDGKRYGVDKPTPNKKLN